MKGKMRMLFAAVAVLPVILLIIGGRECAFFEISGTTPETVISAELSGYGKSVSIEEGEQIRELVNTLKGIGFSPTLQKGAGIPGGASVQIELTFREGRTESVTLPYCSHEGHSYVASTEAIRLFDEWFD